MEISGVKCFIGVMALTLLLFLLRSRPAPRDHYPNENVHTEENNSKEDVEYNPPFILDYNTATIPVIKTNYRGPGDWMEHHLNFNNLTQKGGIHLLFFGDSITYYWKNEGKRIWEIFYSKKKAENYGIGGDKTQNLLWRLQNGNLDFRPNDQPQVAVVLIGTNNAKSNSPHETAEGIIAIIKELRLRIPKCQVILLGIFPREDLRTGIGLNEKNLKTNSLIQKDIVITKDPMIHFMDINQNFLNEDGAIKIGVMHDKLHLTEDGYSIWATAMEPLITTLLE